MSLVILCDHWDACYQCSSAITEYYCWSWVIIGMPSMIVCDEWMWSIILCDHWAIIDHVWSFLSHLVSCVIIGCNQWCYMVIDMSSVVLFDYWDIIDDKVWSFISHHWDCVIIRCNQCSCMLIDNWYVFSGLVSSAV